MSKTETTNAISGYWWFWFIWIDSGLTPALDTCWSHGIAAQEDFRVSANPTIKFGFELSIEEERVSFKLDFIPFSLAYFSVCLSSFVPIPLC